MPKKRNDLEGIKPIDIKAEQKEKYRRKVEITIGVVLILLIIAGMGILSWRGQKIGPKVLGASTDEVDSMQSQITNLNQKIDDLNKKIDELAKAAPTVTESTSTKTVSSGSSSSGSAATISGKVNINTASASQLDALPGIGPTYAARIIEYRNANGGFKTIEEIKNIKGIGDATFAKMKDQISI